MHKRRELSLVLERHQRDEITPPRINCTQRTRIGTTRKCVHPINAPMTLFLKVETCATFFLCSSTRATLPPACVVTASKDASDNAQGGVKNGPRRSRGRDVGERYYRGRAENLRFYRVRALYTGGGGREDYAVWSRKGLLALLTPMPQCVCTVRCTHTPQPVKAGGFFLGPALSFTCCVPRVRFFQTSLPVF